MLSASIKPVSRLSDCHRGLFWPTRSVWATREPNNLRNWPWSMWAKEEAVKKVTQLANSGNCRCKTIRQRWCFWLNETSSYWIMSLIVISPQDTQPIRAEGKVLKLKKLIVIMKKTFNFLCWI